MTRMLRISIRKTEFQSVSLNRIVLKNAGIFIFFFRCRGKMEKVFPF
jgi:hypothetical protein